METLARRKLYSGATEAERATIEKAKGEGRLEDVAELLARGSAKGVDTVDAIGRAFLGGLLGADGEVAAALRDTGRRLHKLYWRTLGSLEPKLNPKPGLYREMVAAGSVVSGVPSEERDAALQDAFNKMLGRLEERGSKARQAVYQLCVDFNPDFGPPWLDRLLAKRLKPVNLARPPIADADDRTMEWAIDGLEALRR